MTNLYKFYKSYDKIRVCNSFIPSKEGTIHVSVHITGSWELAIHWIYQVRQVSCWMEGLHAASWVLIQYKDVILPV